MSSRPSARVLVLSSVTELSARVAVLDAGALDFIAKPFSNDELLARIRSRVLDQRGWSGPKAARSAKLASIKLDVSHRAIIVGDKRTALSQREFVLLAYLLEHNGEVCSRPELLDRVWDLAFEPGTNVVDVYVRRLRVKLGENKIETIRNVGYRLVAYSQVAGARNPRWTSRPPATPLPCACYSSSACAW